ncbi:outer membrane lipoprotein chaperone LolA [Lysobacter sp. H21R4]|uniref:outer membrane lipoprotein chaperone LolA n=1 Tax=Lysobacter sp. H21R4 TaxID=2781021 RepID=UPI001889917F|nr:outer membrane lipoprotein chaperone LolA [Lysobacter sp. H21R4]QOY61655.1 outer membrane lipoprotein chaperone LolA [Lysobacter sp. H21R4]
MNPMIRWGTGLLLGAFVAGSALAGARDDLSQFTKGLTGLDGSFTQQVYDAGGKLKETSTGKVQLSVPHLFRWEYVKPHPQLIVADGKKVWIFDPDLEQVTVRSQGGEEQSSPLSALFEPAKLDQRFVVKETGKADGLDWLSLAPRSDEEASFRTARLGFADAKLVRMEVEDAVGQRTRIEFGAWKRNPDFAASTFKYTPPKGVDVIGEG